MSSDQNQYRPRSPDLPALSSPQNTQQHPQPPPRLNRLPSYQIQEPSLPKGYSFSPRGSYDASPFFSPITQQPPPSYFNFPPAGSPQAAAAVLPKIPTQQNQAYSAHLSQSPQRSTTYENPDLFSQAPVAYPGQPLAQNYLNYPSQSYDEMARLRQRKTVNYNEDHGGLNEFDEQLPPLPIGNNQGPQPFEGQQHFNQAPDLAPLPPQAQSQALTGSMILPKVDVRTKFPVARIKRIMQADEDVGKVAQATPSAVCEYIPRHQPEQRADLVLAKALELFMIALVTKGASEAKAQNSKRVTATHLKNALLRDPQFDFLNEVCESAPDEGAKKRAKSDAKDSDSEDEGDARKKSKGRKKKSGSEADSD